MMLCKFGPRRLSPSLVVWQVRHALLNINCPNSALAPARAGSWGTADDNSRIRNVEQASPTIAMRGMEGLHIGMCAPAMERAAATMCSSIRPSQGMSGSPKRRLRRALGPDASIEPHEDQ